jgi:hypothetical protein
MGSYITLFTESPKEIKIDEIYESMRALDKRFAVIQSDPDDFDPNAEIKLQPDEGFGALMFDGELYGHIEILKRENDLADAIEDVLDELDEDPDDERVLKTLNNCTQYVQIQILHKGHKNKKPIEMVLEHILKSHGGILYMDSGEFYCP